MTEAQKYERLATIKSRAEAMVYVTYWMTRNSSQGLISSIVDVWTKRPDRTYSDGEVVWINYMEGAYWGRWTLDQAYAQVRGGVPDTDRECLRVGPE